MCWFTIRQINNIVGNSGIRLKKRYETYNMITCSCVHDPCIITRSSSIHKLSKEYGMLEITCQWSGLRCWTLIERDVVGHSNGIILSIIASNHSKQLLALLKCERERLLLLCGDWSRFLCSLKSGHLIGPWLGLVSKRISMNFVTFLNSVTK